jgi:hypothetical protein
MYGCCYRKLEKKYRPVFATRAGGYRYGPKSYSQKADREEIESIVKAKNVADELKEKGK